MTRGSMWYYKRGDISDTGDAVTCPALQIRRDEGAPPAFEKQLRRAGKLNGVEASENHLTFQ